MANVELVDMYTITRAEAVKTLRSCHALLMTGGEDVWPGWYRKAHDTTRCTEMNLSRDTLDFTLIRRALENELPVLGICRGHQIMNVILGGTLIIDIPEDVSGHVPHQCNDYLHCNHLVTVREGTLLSRITGTISDSVTTNHHQAIEKPAPGIRIGSSSPDGVPESMEWVDMDSKPFLLGVQWHPERMEHENPFSGALARYFLDQAYQYQQRNKKH